MITRHLHCNHSQVLTSLLYHLSPFCILTLSHTERHVAVQMDRKANQTSQKKKKRVQMFQSIDYSRTLNYSCTHKTDRYTTNIKNI